MKAANADLIALLADSKQFVMWDKYTITLADGTVLTYETRDPDWVPAPPPPGPPLPPPAEPELFLVDTFAGVSTLATHVSDTGTGWYNRPEDYGLTLDDYAVNSGAMSLVPLGSLGPAFSVANTPVNTLDIYMEMDVTIGTFPSPAGLAVGMTTDAQNFDLLTVYFERTFDNPNTYTRLTTTIFTENDSIFEIGSSSADDPSKTYLLPLTITANTTYTVRVQFTNERQTVELTLNGITCFTRTLGAGPGLLNPGNLGAFMSTDGNGVAYMNRLRGETTA